MEWTKPELIKAEGEEHDAGLSKLWDMLYLEACIGYPSFSDIQIIQDPQAPGEIKTCRRETHCGHH